MCQCVSVCDQGDLQSTASVQAIARQVCEQLIQSELTADTEKPEGSRSLPFPSLTYFPPPFLSQVTWLGTTHS